MPRALVRKVYYVPYELGALQPGAVTLLTTPNGAASCARLRLMATIAEFAALYAACGVEFDGADFPYGSGPPSSVSDVDGQVCCS